MTNEDKNFCAENPAPGSHITGEPIAYIKPNDAYGSPLAAWKICAVSDPGARAVYLDVPPAQTQVDATEAAELSRINAALDAIRSTCFTVERDDRHLIGHETIAHLRDAAKLINELVFQSASQPPSSLPNGDITEKVERHLEISGGRFSLGDRVRKTKGSSWQGRVVGFYVTKLTPYGYAVESEREPGSVQIYPESALEIFHDR